MSFLLFLSLLEINIPPPPRVLHLSMERETLTNTHTQEEEQFGTCGLTGEKKVNVRAGEEISCGEGNLMPTLSKRCGRRK